MVKVDLITGFLGAGKTTFIRRYADYFMRKGKRINIIENEFGSVNVDAVMLKDGGFHSQTEKIIKNLYETMPDCIWP
ncbi:MAG: GTP-binding protein [Lachnospiraceae bacterium]|jgi:G3E family GTPase|nr:GTP-binding protein [Lachnospiraceae bacterium]